MLSSINSRLVDYEDSKLEDGDGLLLDLSFVAQIKDYNLEDDSDTEGCASIQTGAKIGFVRRIPVPEHRPNGADAYVYYIVLSEGMS
jgi:hypothetical protein